MCRWMQKTWAELTEQEKPTLPPSMLLLDPWPSPEVADFSFLFGSDPTLLSDGI